MSGNVRAERSARRLICICTRTEIAADRPFSACIADDCQARPAARVLPDSTDERNERP